MHINNFGPFQADVWGTVSDWIMIGVTTGTAIFLYLTLKSQQKVQKLQQSITDIESYRFRESIKPEFDIQVKSDIISSTGNSIKLKAYYTLKTKKHAAHNVIISVIDDNDQFKPENFENPVHFDNVELNNHLLLYGEFETECLYKNEKAIFFAGLKIFIDYSDIKGNKYEQRISYIITDENPIELVRIPVLKKQLD